MAIRPSVLFPTKTGAPSAEYPFGEARNVTTSDDGTGTPFDQSIVNDKWGFFQNLLSRAGITPTGTPDKVGASEYTDALDKMYIQGVDGRGYKLLAGVLANTGSGWTLATSGNQRSAGYGAVTVANGRIEIAHEQTGAKVVSVIAVPNSVYGAMGLQVSADIVDDKTTISLAAPLEFSVDSASGGLTLPDPWTNGDFSVTADGATCSITHPVVADNRVPHVSPAGIEPSFNTDVVSAYTSSLINLTPVGPISGRVTCDGATFFYEGPLFNAPTFSFEASPTSRLTVTHALDRSHANDVQLTPCNSLYPQLSETLLSQNSFATIFRDITDEITPGNKFHNVDARMDFTFSRPGTARLSEIRGAFTISRGIAKCNAGNVSSSTGLIQVLALQEV